MIQIDMEMPKACATCQFYYMANKKEKYQGIVKTTSFRCIADMRLRRLTLKELCTDRAKNCPLKEVKELNNES